MRSSALIPATLLALMWFVVWSSSSSSHDARAAAPRSQDVCKRAKEQLGAQIERGMRAEDCQLALDAAEEERWQLWLDIAAADELGGDLERAALSLNRFVIAADRRERPLPAHWVVVRDEARASIARMDGELLKSKGRVTITSNPDGAEATILGAAALTVEKTPKTPLTLYFAPGTHTVRLRMPDTDAAREVQFTVAAGATVILQVDLRKTAKPDTAVVENLGPPVLGQRPVTDGGPPPAPTSPPSPTETTIVDEPTEVPGDAPIDGAPEDGPADIGEVDDDPEGPPIRTSSSLTESLGTVSIAAGGAALAIGVTFALIASGLDEQAACSGRACDSQPELRAHVRRDADVAWDRATGTFIVGGLLVAGGIVMIVLDDDGPDETALLPWIAPDGAGLGGRVSF